MAETLADYYALLPFITLLLGSVLAFAAGKFMPDRKRAGTSGTVATVAFIVTLAMLIWLLWELVENGTEYSFQYGMVRMSANGLALLISLVASSMGLLVSIYSVGYMEGKKEMDKFYALLLLMVAGMVGIGFSQDLFNLFVAFELMSIASFALVAFERDKWEPVEAGVKYIMLSGAGSALALVGIALTYSVTGTTELEGIRLALRGASDFQGAMPMAALILMVVGFGVKTAMVPLHTWLPDAHSAAPSGISAMLSGIVIQAGLVMLLKSVIPFLYDGGFTMAGGAALPTVPIGFALAVMAVVTMTAGNLLALRQRDLKRMLAYSSIAQIGYILLGVGLYLYAPAVAEVGLWGGFLHIITHAFMKGGAFLCAGAVIYAIGTRDMVEMRGIGRRHVVVGVCFAIFALSLSGLPPFSGFVSEFLIVRGGVDIAMVGVGMGNWALIFVAAILANSVLSLGYYIPAINRMLFSKEPGPKVKDARPLPKSITVPLVIMAGLTIAFGVYPDLGLQMVEPAVEHIQDFVGIAAGAGGV